MEERKVGIGVVRDEWEVATGQVGWIEEVVLPQVWTQSAAGPGGADLGD